MLFPWLLIATFVGVFTSQNLHKIQEKLDLQGTSDYSKATDSYVLSQGTTTATLKYSPASIDVTTIGTENAVTDIESSTKHQLSSSSTNEVTSPDSISKSQSKYINI